MISRRVSIAKERMVLNMGSLKQKFESLDPQFIENNLYSIKVEVLGGTFGHLFTECALELYFRIDDEIGEELTLSLDYFGCDGNNYCYWEPCHTYILRGGNKSESWNTNEFLDELIRDIKDLISQTYRASIFSRWLRDDELPFEEYEEHQLPTVLNDTKYDLRKHIDSEYVYVLSLGIEKTTEQGVFYKKAINCTEHQYDFLMDFFDIGRPFYKAVVENNLMKLKDYTRFFLANNQKRYGLDYLDKDQRYLYDAKGNGIRCPACNELLIYSTSEKKYMCPDCNRIFTKEYLEELTKSTVLYEQLPKIYK